MNRKKKVTEVQGAEVQNPENQNAEIIQLTPEQTHVKFAMNLDQTLQLVHDLFQKKRQRDKLVGTIEELKVFDIEKRDNYLDSESSYTGAKLVLSDDKNRGLTIKNPALIQDVVNYLKDRCTEKLGEIEAEIVLPA